jgi:hypothetical protein
MIVTYLQTMYTAGDCTIIDVFVFESDDHLREIETSPGSNCLKELFTKHWLTLITR